MTDATDALKSEIDRIGHRIGELEKQLDQLRETRAEIRARKAGVGSGVVDADSEALAFKVAEHLKIEDEQAAEHERLIGHMIEEQSKRLDSLIEDLEVIQGGRVV